MVPLLEPVLTLTSLRSARFLPSSPQMMVGRSQIAILPRGEVERVASDASAGCEAEEKQTDTM